MDVYLSKDAKKLMRLIYREYKRRLRKGIPESKAVHFESLTDQPAVFRKTFEERYMENKLLVELKKANLIIKHIRFSFTLLPDGIVYMQHRHDKWKDRAIAFASGVVAAVIAQILVQVIVSLCSQQPPQQ